MNPDEDFAAWSLEYRDRLINFKDETVDTPVVTDFRTDAQLGDYTPLSRSRSKYIIDWGRIRRYCNDIGYVAKDFGEGVRKVYRFDPELGYYRYVPIADFANELNRQLIALAPDLPPMITFQKQVEAGVVVQLPLADDLTKRSACKRIAEPYLNGEVIPFRNGIYSINLNTLLPRTSCVFIENYLDVDFDPKALSDPISLRYKDIMCGKSDLFELLFEILGYILYARTFYVPTCAIFYGSGANGKSTVLNVLSKILGERNISMLTLNDLTSAFAVARSEGKIVNISHDSSPGPGKSLISTSNIVEFIKKSTSGEMHCFNPKNGKMYNGHGPRNFIFATNVSLNFGGMDGGMIRRMYAVPFNATFRNDPAVEAEFKEENAVKWFAMQALISLMCMLRRRMGDSIFTNVPVCGEYIKCEVSEEMKQEQVAMNDTVMDWISEDLDLDFTDKTAVRDALVGVGGLWETYSRYCIDSGRTPKKRRAFNMDLRTNFNIAMDVRKSNGHREYIPVDADSSTE